MNFTVAVNHVSSHFSIALVVHSLHGASLFVWSIRSLTATWESMSNGDLSWYNQAMPQRTRLLSALWKKEWVVRDYLMHTCGLLLLYSMSFLSCIETPWSFPHSWSRNGYPSSEIWWISSLSGACQHYHVGWRGHCRPLFIQAQRISCKYWYSMHIQTRTYLGFWVHFDVVKWRLWFLLVLW